MNYEDRFTPRDRVLDKEVVDEYAVLFAAGSNDWELYYSDGSRILGSTQEQWDAAPNNDIQILIWKTSIDDSIHIVYGSDEYILGGVIKYGKWMNDPAFFKLRDTVHSRSPLCMGNLAIN